MGLNPERWDPKGVESAAWAFWTARHLERANGPFGPATGPVVHQFLGTVFPFDRSEVLEEREIAADAWSRVLAGQGRRSLTSYEVYDATLAAEGSSLASDRRPRGLTFELPPLPAESGVQLAEMVAHLASIGAIVRVTGPLLTCLRCGLAPSPETTIYQEERADSYVIRFPLVGVPGTPSLLVWTDSAWKLLGTSALLVAPDQPYATVRFRNRGTEELVVLARHAVPRLKEWFPESTVEIVEERPGTALQGSAYLHPLGGQFPPLWALTSPSGIVHTDPEVRPHGTGVVPVVPAHGPRDAAVASRLQLSIWPVLGQQGLIEGTLQHNYAGLPLADAEAFALRDLLDDGNIFSIAPTRRGIPHCAMCGSELEWVPGESWGLRPSQLPPVALERLRRLIGRPTWGASLVAPWPLASLKSEASPTSVLLRECERCDRLASPKAEGPCSCGGLRRTVGRDLLPGVRGGLLAALRQKPYSPGETIRLVTHERHHFASLAHLLLGLVATGDPPVDVRWQRLPSLPHLLPPSAVTDPPSIDAYRIALLSRSGSPRAPDTVVHEGRDAGRILSRLWAIARSTLEATERVGFVPDVQPIARPTDLLPEDRAVLARFERLRAEVLRQLEQDNLAGASALLRRYLARDLIGGFRTLIAPRLRDPSGSETVTSALRTLWHILPLSLELLGTMAPFTSEELHRGLRGDRQSLFQRPITPVQQGLLDSGAEGQLDRWLAVDRALRTLRTRWGVPPAANFQSVVLALDADTDVADYVRDTEVLKRLSACPAVGFASPGSPFDRYDSQVHPVVEELQRAYGMQAPRIAHVLARMDAGRVRDGLKASSLTVALGGQAVPITAPMVEVSTALRLGWALQPFAAGILYAELPRGLNPKNDPPRYPRLSNPVARFAAELERISLAARGDVRASLEVSVTGPQRTELTDALPSILRALDRVDAVTRDLPSDGVRLVAAGHAGRLSSWRIGMAGAGPRPAHGDGSRYRFAAPRVRHPGPIRREPSPEADLLSDVNRERAAILRETQERLDTALGAPYVGAAKLGFAWDAGVRTYEDFSRVPYEQLAPIPGFGPQVAEVIVLKFGGEIPPKPPRVPLSSSAGEMAPEASRDGELAVIDAPVSAADSAASQEEPAPGSTEDEGRGGDSGASDGAGVMAGAAAAAALAGELATPPAPVEPAVPAGGLEFSVGGTDTAWSRFMDAAAAGHRGLCISREFPDRIRARIGPRNVLVLWLSNAGREGSVRPTDLAGIRAAIGKAVDADGVSIVYLAGIEYLMLLQPPESIVELLKALDEVGRSRSVRLWAPVEPELADSTKLAAVVANFPPTG